jgi:hypothetical protein
MLFTEFITESQKKLDYIAKNMGDKLLRALHDDTSEETKKIIKSARSLSKDPADIEAAAADVIKALEGADPSRDKHDFMQFIARMYAAKQFKLEDIGRLRGELEKFVRFKNQIQNKDLNSYKTLPELYDAIEAVDPAAAEEKSKAQKDRDIKTNGAETIINDKDMKIVRLKTFEAAQLYSAGTRWCTSQKGQFDYYSGRDDLYVIMCKIDGKIRKFQFHYKTQSIMDEQDQRVGRNIITELSKFPGWKDFLNKMIETHYSNHVAK